MAIYVGKYGLLRIQGDRRYFMKYPTRRFPSRIGGRRTHGRWLLFKKRFIRM